ncbi:hypothetical protein DSO57_1015779 [Entomophthora muscae]|uniref:Uncharacterized protein n=1 Tax=Entomophthora muscae TaxID=34485 RepID=A0ACC2T509_9FUNG|nr:hypothetical protein DSO57_1015779 [Entomophthora muscae]
MPYFEMAFFEMLFLKWRVLPKIKAVLDTGSPVNVVSSKLVKKLKLAPNLNYHQTYGTAGLSMTCAIGDYSALHMSFGKLLLALPTVVLENESYNFLVGT